MTDLATPAPGVTRSRRAKVVVAVLALAVLVAGGLGVRWWTHPTAFGDLGGSYASGPRPVARAALSTAVTYPKDRGEPETVTIDRIEPVLSENTAEASTAFFVCHMSKGENMIGAMHHPGAACHDFVPFEAGQSFHRGVGHDGDYLFVTLTPTRPGVARLAEVRITYRRDSGHLYQRGTETIHAVTKLVAR